MVQRRVLWALASLNLLLAGCQTLPTALPRPRLTNRDAVARGLPSPIRLDMPVNCNVPQGETVEQALLKVGAHVRPDGKLYCAAGKEIRFDYRASGGPPQPPPSKEQMEAAARASRNLATRYTIIEVLYLHC